MIVQIVPLTKEKRETSRFFFFSAMYAVPAYDLITAQRNVYYLSTLKNDAFNSFQRDLENIRRDLSDSRMNNDLLDLFSSNNNTFDRTDEPMGYVSPYCSYSTPDKIIIGFLLE